MEALTARALRPGKPGRAKKKGSWTSLRHGYYSLGRALHTRTSVKPIYISPGHKVTLPRATEIVLAATARPRSPQASGYRLPEPTRQAHHAVTLARSAG